MKKSIVYVLALLLAAPMMAQIQSPQPSPSSKLMQKVGLTDVTVEYSRPSMKGRTVMGNLVPFDKMWRTGANQNTMITFSTDAMIGGKTLKAGTYAIFTKPGASNWDVYFYTDTNNWGTPQEWDEGKVAATYTAEVMKMDTPVETFTITIDDLHNNGATLGILWENTYVGVPFMVPAKEMTMKSIETVMNGPSANDYFAAATFYFQEGEDLGKAKQWIDKAVSMNPNAFWMMRAQSLIYAKMGDKKGAIEAAKKSLAAAKAANNADYVKMNEDSLKEWGGM
ncbi:Protein of unknown function [Muriicola jejuensis]|uniref:DUF2911 domain-containing protein n=1 Tax=Muriicola jejuensis TaxID=504488 RepID=A0A6P0UE33_9FLAO|nr:DUF2911 domain-containing protein [Muriicola jejuensis]NER11475.1 DUF2911 domain-containing protein [Muriicola jejuensis]SMP20471.1 Protein of unknown function [Muriicola jejuensis]